MAKPKIQWIEQVDEGGCSVACLAMLMDTTYARVRDEYKKFCPTCGPAEDEQIDQFLAEHGFALQRIYRYRAYDDQWRKWPPTPWAERHLAMVTQTKSDYYSHYVVMDYKGNVYDPADKEYKSGKLRRYYEVEWVAGVFPCIQPSFEPDKKLSIIASQ